MARQYGTALRNGSDETGLSHRSVLGGETENDSGVPLRRAVFRAVHT